MDPLLILNLIGLAATELKAFTTGQIAAGAGLSADLVTALTAVLKQHSANTGIPIEQVIAEL